MIKMLCSFQEYSKVIQLYVCILFQIPFLLRLLQNIEQTSLCYAVGPCWLSILNTVVYITSIWDAQFIPSPLPLW